MHSLALLFPLLTAASPLLPRAPATCALDIKSTEHICNQASTNVQAARSKGFVGKIGSYIINTYGYTSSVPDQPSWNLPGSVALGTDDPCKVRDTILASTEPPAPGEFLTCLVEYNETTENTELSGSNILQFGAAGAQSMMFYTKKAPKGEVIGAGVALVSLTGDDQDIPAAERKGEVYWKANDGEPAFGETASYVDGDYIYALGPGSSRAPTAYGEKPPSQYTFLARVPKTGWQDASNFQYWDGSKQDWTTKRLTGATSNKALSFSQGVPMTQIGQGHMFYSEYYKKLVFVYTKESIAPEESTSVFAVTSDAVTGPWSAEKTLFSVEKGQGFIKYPTVNPYLDPSGKTFVISVTNFDKAYPDERGPAKVLVYKVTLN